MPNSTTEPTIAWDKDVPIMGKYTATANVRFLKRFQPGSQALHAAAAAKTISFWIAPWNYLIFAFFIILACAALCAYNTLHFKKILSSAEKYQVAENDDIVAIAAKRNINWKKIAQINRLKPPFIIRKGQEIYLPKSKKQ
jgi:hypothetical protein